MKQQLAAHDIEAAYGIVAEELLSNERLRGAVETVLMLQLELQADRYRDSFNKSERADVASRMEAHARGIEEGIEVAHDNLLDLDVIKTHIENAKQEDESV